MWAAVGYFLVSVLQDILATVELIYRTQENLTKARPFTLARSIASLIPYIAGILWLMREPGQWWVLSLCWIASDMVGLELGIRLKRWIEKRDEFKRNGTG